MHEGSAELNQEEEMIVAISAEHLPANSENKVSYRNLGTGSHEELELKGNAVTVRIYPSGLVHRRYTPDFKLIKTFWCEFPINETIHISGLCLAGEEKMIFVCDIAEHLYTIAFPIQIDRIFKCSKGLVLQKKMPPKQEQSAFTFPALFSLSHPYSEVLPVICKNRESESTSHYIWDVNELSIVEVLTDVPVLIAYSSVTLCHSLYTLRKCTENELKIAASKAESVISFNTSAITSLGGCSRTSTPLVGSRLRKFNDPSFSEHDDSWRTPQSRTVRTRSMTSAAALLQSVPFPTTSPAQKNLSGRFTKDSPMVCLECIWVEPGYKHPYDINEPASHAFITKDLMGHKFVCFFIKRQKVLKCVEIKVIDEEHLTTNIFTEIPCLDASAAECLNYMAIVDLDGSVIIYSGPCRLGILFMENVSLESKFLSKNLKKFQGGKSIMCKLAPLCSSQYVKRCLFYCLHLIPMEKCMRVLIDWCLLNVHRMISKNQGNQMILEFTIFIEFILNKCGFMIEHLPAFDEITSLKSRCDDDIIEKRKRRETNIAPSEAMRQVEIFLAKNAAPPSVMAPRLPDPDVTVNINAILYPHVLTVFRNMHGIYESSKLDTRIVACYSSLTPCINIFARLFRMYNIASHYAKDFPKFIAYQFDTRPMSDDLWRSHMRGARNINRERIPSLHDHMMRILNLNIRRSKLVLRCQNVLLIVAVGLGRCKGLSDLQIFFGKMYQQSLALSDHRIKVLLQIITDKNDKPQEKCKKLCNFFGCTKLSLQDYPPSIALILSELFYCPSTKSLCFVDSPTTSKSEGLPTKKEVDEIAHLRWPSDLRMNNVLQMLDSHRPIFIPTNTEVSAADQREKCEHLLLAAASRVVAQCFGRCAIDLRSYSPPSNSTLKIKKICFQGRLHPANTSFELPTTDATKQLNEWGTFYNAVAAGLRVGDSENLHLDCEWLAMNVIAYKKDGVGAGLMYAFGLNGHVNSMNLFNTHELLSTNDRLMSIAILLGYAVNCRTSCDVKVHKMIITHLPFLMGPTLLDLHIDPMVQTAAMVALGLLFAQSTHLSLLGQLINEIGRPASPEREPSPDRYSHSLAAGFAIGLIALGRGEDLSTNVPFVEKYPPLASRLVVLMEGGPRSLCVFSTGDASDLLPLLGQATCLPTTSQYSNHAKELENVNPHLTSAAATVALGLMYLQTNNKWAADCLQIPDTIVTIEAVKPEVILLRTLCRHLILWDEIMVSQNWVESCVPSMIIKYKNHLFDNAGKEEQENIEKWLLQAAVDSETVAQTYLHAVAGACFAMALRFASTWNAEAFKTIMHYTQMVLPTKPSTESLLRTAAGRPACFNVLNSLISSLAILMAGSGNLDVLRICRMMRFHVIQPNAFRDTTAYNVYVTSSTAIGMLMLGRGRYALKTDALSVASLVIAFYPVNPQNVADNRMYLQILRMLWVIACDERLLCPYDTDLKRNMMEGTISVKFRPTKFCAGDTIKFNMPCVIPELSLLSEITVHSPGYETQTYDLQSDNGIKAIKEILSRKHGKLLMSQAGRALKATEPNFSTTEETKDDVLREVTDEDLRDLMKVPEVFGSELDEEEEYSEKLRRANLDAYIKQIQNFQLENGTMAAQDYAVSFVRDVLEKREGSFYNQQLDEMAQFLEALESSRGDDNRRNLLSVIPAEIIYSLCESN